MKSDGSVKSDILARKTISFSPSDIENMVREAGIIALRDSRDTISMKDLSEAYDRFCSAMKAHTTVVVLDWNEFKPVSMVWEKVLEKWESEQKNRFQKVLMRW